MEEFENILVDGEFIPLTIEDLTEVQELPCFSGCTLDIWDDISCDERDLKNIILTDGMSFIGKGYLQKIIQTPSFIELFEKQKYYNIIIRGTFDAILTNGIYRKFYI